MNDTNDKNNAREAELEKSRALSSETAPKVAGSYETPLINGYRWMQAEAERLERVRGRLFTENQAAYEAGDAVVHAQIEKLSKARHEAITDAQEIFNSDDYRAEVQRERAAGHVIGALLPVDVDDSQNQIQPAVLSEKTADIEAVENTYAHFFTRTGSQTVAATLTQAWATLAQHDARNSAEVNALILSYIPPGSVVQCIKLVREWSGFSLLDAKAICDRVVHKGEFVDLAKDLFRKRPSAHELKYVAQRFKAAGANVDLRTL